MTHPLLIEAEELESRLGDPALLVVDLCKPEVYVNGHIPGAVHLDYAQIISADPPRGGLLPGPEPLTALFSDIGVDAKRHVVAYDDEGGGRAARLLWTLAAYGHTRYSLLNGGLHAWANEGHPLTTDPVMPEKAKFEPRFQDDVVADRSYILGHLNDSGVKLLDTRTPGEYMGTDVRAARGGHIPGAINLNWTDCMDQGRNLRLKPREQLEGMLAERGITPSDTVITYCQTHHRSAHTWFVLKYLGYERARGYPGAWSDWGNQPDTPVES